MSSFGAILGKHKSNCENSIAAFKRDLQKVRTGRASSGLVESVMVDYYGSKTALLHLGQITTPDTSTISIQVFDAGAVSAVEKAIQNSGLGFNPSVEGNIVRIRVPALTEERRKEIVQHLNKMGEDSRVSIRNHRRDANDEAKTAEKAGELTQDDSKKVQDKVQKQTDSFIKEIEGLLQQKEAECMEV